VHRLPPLDEIIHGNYPKEWLTAEIRQSVGASRCILFLIYLAWHYNLDRSDARPSLKGFAAKHLDGNTWRASEISDAVERSRLIRVVGERRKGRATTYTFDTWYNPIAPDDSSPGVEPSQEPSQEPSRQPSRQPSQEPSRQPSQEPSRDPVNEQNNNLNVNLTEQQTKLKRLAHLWDPFLTALSDNLPKQQQHLANDLKYASAYTPFEQCLANGWDPEQLGQATADRVDTWQQAPGSIVGILKDLQVITPPKKPKPKCDFHSCNGSWHEDPETTLLYRCPGINETPF